MQRQQQYIGADSQAGLRLSEAAKALKSSLFTGIEVDIWKKHICIKDRVLLDDTCGNGGFLVRTKKQRGDME